MIMRSTCPWHIHNSPLAAQGARFGGGKGGGGGGTTYQTQTTQIPPEVRARYDAVNARAEQVAQQPFVPYTGQFVAPINPLQEAAINQIGQATQGYQPYQQAATTALTGAAEAALPYYGQAGESIQQAQAAGAPYTGLATAAGLAGTQAVNPQTLQIERYMDPYIQSVVAPTMQGLYQQQQQQQSQLMGEQAMRGAFGGDRGAIAAANLARQQGLAAQQAQAGLLSGAYGQALQAAQQQQGVGLGAAQANRAALQQFTPQALAIGQQAFGQPMAAAQAQQQLGQGVLGYGQGVAQGLAGLGQQGTQTGLAAGQALLGAGTLGQQTQQQLNAAFYNQFLQQQGYPFQVAQFLANIALGTGPLYGSTTSGTTTVPTPFFSDERVKEDITEIGRTHDGQKIIKFRYKGEPEGTKHIGLSAQDVERHHPEAVSETAEGIKAVDYDAATKHAERAYGGGLLPMTSEGGAVHPSMAGLGFARGGVPGVDDYSQQLLQQLVNPLSGTTPHSSMGKMPGAPQSWKPGLSVKPQRSLGSDVRLAPPQQQPTGLSQLTSAAKTGADLYGTGEKIYEGGQKAVDWFKKQAANQQPAQTGYAASNAPGQIKTESLPPPSQSSQSSAPGLGTAAPQATADATGLAPSDTASAIADALPAEDLSDVTSMFAARGGRMHRAAGGRMGYAGGLKVDLPYDSKEQDTPLSDITEEQPDAKLQDTKLPGVAGPSGAGVAGPSGGGAQKDKTASTALDLAALGAGLGANFFIPGVGPFVSAGLKGLSRFAADGGRIGYATDGKVDYTSIVGRGESGNRNVRNPLSGAEGEFQFMPPTWAAARKALPHLPANIRESTPEQRLEAMNWLTGENRRALSSSLGRDPSNAELRYAHYFGPSGAAALMKMDSGTRFADLPQDFWHKLGEKFTNTTFLAQNPNLRDETLGGLLNKYRGEFKEGLAPMPTAEHVMARREPPRPGLAPPMVTDVEDLNEDEEDNNEFARGGIAGRHGYQAGGEPEPWDSPGQYLPDYLDPAVRQRAREQEVRGAKFEPPGQMSADVMPSRGLAPPTPPVTVEADPQRMLETGVRTASYEQPEQATAGYMPQRGLAGTSPRVATPSSPSVQASVSPNVAAPASTGVAPPLPAATNVRTAPNFPEVAAAPSSTQSRGLVPPDVVTATTPAAALPPASLTGDWFERNHGWVMPFASGIGNMLASRSPFFLNALGEGIVGGGKTYLEQQGRDIQQQQADIAAARQLYGVYSDLGMRIANAETLPDGGGALAPLRAQYNNLGKQINALIGKYVKTPQQATELLTDGGGPSGGGAQPAPANAPVQTPPVSLPPPADQSDVPKWARRAQTTPEQQAWMKQNIDPNRDPAVLYQRAQAALATDPKGEVAARLKREADEVQMRMNDKGEIPTRGGGFATMPGWNERRSEVERVADNTKWMNDYEPKQVQVQSQLVNINDLTNALQEVQAGPAAGTINKYTALIAQLAGVDVNTMLSNPDAYYKARKDAYKVINDTFGPSGARSDMQLNTTIAGSASPDLPPNTNKGILAQLKAKAEWVQARDKWISDQIYRYGTHIDRGAAAREWEEKNENELIKRTGEVHKNIAVLGDTEGGFIKSRDGKMTARPGFFKDGQMYMMPVDGKPVRVRARVAPDGTPTFYPE